MWFMCKKTVSTSVYADTKHEAWLKFLRMEKEGRIIMDIEIYPEEVESEVTTSD